MDATCCVCPAVPEAAFMRSKLFWLRMLAFVFAIAVFAPLAEMAGWDYGPAVFALATGISDMVLATLRIVGMILGQPFARGLVPMIVDCFWGVLWLACAAVLSKELNDYNRLSIGLDEDWASDIMVWGDATFSEYKTRMSVAVAFAWLAWSVGVAEIVVDVLDVKRGKGTSLPPSAAAAGRPAEAAKPIPTTEPHVMATAV